MTKLTKADIDGLVERLAAIQARDAIKYPGKRWYNISRDLYLAAGLTEEGEPKPERVRGWLVPRYYPDGKPLFTTESPGAQKFRKIAIPGYFVPDGVE